MDADWDLFDTIYWAVLFLLVWLQNENGTNIAKYVSEDC